MSFKCRKFPAQFTIIDSSLFIEVHLDSARDVPTACPRIRKLIYDGIKKCSDVLHYHSLKLLKDGFACSNKSCKGVATPYDGDPNLASCTSCSTDMDLTSNHTIWITEERKYSNGTLPHIIYRGYLCVWYLPWLVYDVVTHYYM